MARQRLCTLSGLVLIVSFTCQLLCFCVDGARYSKNLQYALQRLDRTANLMLEKTGIPGMTVGIVLPDGKVQLRAYGVKEKGGSDPVDVHTIFQLASVSKSLGATAVSRAIHENSDKVSWTDPYSKYLPYKLNDSYVTQTATIQDLYAHRSGLPSLVGGSLQGMGLTTQEVYERLYLYPLKPFRITYAYNNHGIAMGADAAAAALNMTFDDLAQKYLFDPLNMTSSSTKFEHFWNATNRVTPHVWSLNKDNVKPGCHQCSGTFTPAPKEIWSDGYPAASGGINSNLVDMVAWLKWFMQEVNTTGTYLQSMATPQVRMSLDPTGTPDEPSKTRVTEPWTFYGGGLEITSHAGETVMTHSGGFTTGTNTAFRFVPALGFGIVTLNNGAALGNAAAFAESFIDAALTGKPRTLDQYMEQWWPSVRFLYDPVPTSPLVGKQPPSPCKPSRDMHAYDGIYNAALYGYMIVRAVPSNDSNAANGLALGMAFTPDPKEAVQDDDFMPLTCWGDDVFSWSGGVDFFRVIFDGNSTGSPEVAKMDPLEKDVPNYLTWYYRV